MRVTFSIVIPYFRCGKYIAQAVESLRAQRFTNYEVLLINDGSEDDPRDILCKFPERFQYLWQHNKGLPMARNVGINMAKGEYLIFLDADDLLSPQALEAHLNVMNRYGEVISVGAFRHLYESSGEVGPIRSPDSEWTPLPFLIHQNIAPPHSFCVPRSVLARVGLFRKEPYGCEDWDLWLRCALFGVRFATTSQLVAIYRKRPESMSTNIDRMLVGRTYVLLKAHELILRNDLLLAEYADELAKAEIRVFRRLCSRRIKGQPRRDLAAAYRELSGRKSDIHTSGLGGRMRRRIGLLYDQFYISLCRYFRRDYITALQRGFA